MRTGLPLNRYVFALMVAGALLPAVMWAQGPPILGEFPAEEFMDFLTYEDEWRIVDLLAVHTCLTAVLVGLQIATIFVVALGDRWSGSNDDS